MKQLFGQIARFGIVGGALTMFVSGAYLFLLRYSAASPSIALTVATLVASFIGYFAHSGISFRNFGQRDRPLVRLSRSLLTNLTGFLLNLSAVYLLITMIGLPEWTPVLFFCFVTPIVSFMINRKWVFA